MKELDLNAIAANKNVSNNNTSNAKDKTMEKKTVIRKPATVAVESKKSISINEPTNKYIDIDGRFSGMYGIFSAEYRIYYFWLTQRTYAIERFAYRIRTSLGQYSDMVTSDHILFLGQYFDMLIESAMSDVQDCADSMVITQEEESNMSDKELVSFFKRGGTVVATVEEKSSRTITEEERNELVDDLFKRVGKDMNDIANVMISNIKSTLGFEF